MKAPFTNGLLQARLNFKPKYVAYDYEMPGEAGDPRNFWHIYTLDNELAGIVFGGNSILTILTIVGPETEAMHEAVKAICKAIDHAITLCLEAPA